MKSESKLQCNWSRCDQLQKIRIGIIGAGRIIAQSITAMRQQGTLLPSAVCSRPESFEKAKAAALEHSIPECYPDADTLLREADVEAVYIAVNNDAHFEAAKKALEAGKHVLMEKPFCSNSSQAKALFDLAQSRGLFLLEAAQTRFAPWVGIVKEWLPAIGRIRIVSADYSQKSRKYDDFRAGGLPAAFDPARSGGVMMDLGVYAVHFHLCLFGCPEKVTYTANIERGIDTSGILTFAYPDFVSGSVIAKDCTGPSGFWIKGEKGVIASDCRLNDITRLELKTDGTTSLSFDEGRAGSRMIHEMAEFARIIRENDSGACRKMAEETLAAMDILDRAVRSKETKKP